jgi:hypothetical protein
MRVGRVAKKTAEGVTHALFQRFSTKEDLDQYMQNPQRWRIARELVIPFYHVNISQRNSLVALQPSPPS